ncbi:MAG: hypothetical protein V4489_03990 [Chlamydiota bacterium]
MRIYFLLLGVLLISTACAPKSHWKHSQIDGSSSQHDSSRLSYKTPNTHNTLQMEIIHRKKSCKGYLFVQGRVIPESKDHPKQALISMQIAGETTSYLVPRYEGGHRLSLPEDLLQKILQTLEEGKEVTLLTSGYLTTLDPKGFSSIHEKWKKNSYFHSFIKTSF